MRETLACGRARRARALARIYARTASPESRAWFALYEANALLWEGEHRRAVRLADKVARLPGAEALGVLPLVVKLEALIFEENVGEARALFAANEAPLRATKSARGDVVAIDAMLRFADGDLEKARTEMLRVFRLSGPLDPIRRVAHFVLAAIAHKNGDAEEARARLEAAAYAGGDLFVVRWAKSQIEELFPADASTKRLSRARAAFRRTLDMVGAGLGLAFFRSTSFARQEFSVDRVLGLALFDAVLLVALRAAAEYQPGASAYWLGIVALVAPLAGVALTTRMAAGPMRDVAMRIAGGFYAALPVFAVVASAIGRVRWSNETLYALASGALLIWSSAVFVVAVRAVHRIRLRRLAATWFVFVALFGLPSLVVNEGLVFYPPIGDVRDFRAEEKRREALLLAQADELHAAEDALVVERPGVTDLYFLGAGLWARQDVFGRDVRYAQRVVDDRFQSTRRSTILVNDPFGPERAPLASAVSLRHAIRQVGRHMDREEDVLFLYLTSHGSAEGLALSFPRDSAYRSDTLTPGELRSMLDESGIRHRILVIAGCESGVFLAPLSSETSVVATAAAPDRSSHGCAMGNEHTDFGRAVFANRLKSEPTIVGALRAAIADIDDQETREGITPSRPQLTVGSAIEKKLAELERSR